MKAKNATAIEPKEEKPPYQPTEKEQAVLAGFNADKKARKPWPNLKIEKIEGVNYFQFAHEDIGASFDLYMHSLGTTDFELAAGLLHHVAALSEQRGEPVEANANFVLAVIRGIEPKDPVEAMLATQMAAVHMATITSAHHLAHAEHVKEQDSASTTFNKLTRTFAAQAEALKRYRSTGSQRMTVEHVTVEAGGQAIVGNVTHGGKPANDAGPAPAPNVTTLEAPGEAPLTSERWEGVGGKTKVRATP